MIPSNKTPLIFFALTLLLFNYNSLGMTQDRPTHHFVPMGKIRLNILISGSLKKAQVILNKEMIGHTDKNGNLPLRHIPSVKEGTQTLTLTNHKTQLTYKSDIRISSYLSCKGDTKPAFSCTVSKNPPSTDLYHLSYFL